MMCEGSSYQRGFTLIELMIAVAILAILSSIAYPSYTAYVQRSRVPPGLDALSAYAVRMEQRYQDTGDYLNSAKNGCGVAVPTGVANFTITCTLRTNAEGANKGFTATATGSGMLTNFVYTIDDTGARATTSHPKGRKTDCWTIRGGTCDS